MAELAERESSGGGTHGDASADLALVRAAVAGDGDAARRLVERLDFVRHVLHAQNRRLGTPFAADDVEDLAQDVRACVWARLPSFRGGSTLRTWVYAFCSHGLWNGLRARRRERVARSPRTLSQLDEPAAPAARRVSEAEAVAGALATLPEAPRAALRMHLLEGMTFDEIGRVLDLAPGTVKSRVRRSLAQLRIALLPYARAAGLTPQAAASAVPARTEAAPR